jgi:exodeoxyribonuclease V
MSSSLRRRAGLLTDEQADAIERLNARLRIARVAVLAGPAGCGKSTVLAQLADENPSAIMAAPTGKAASILAAKTGRPADTVHRIVFRLIHAGSKRGRPDLHFAEAHKPGALAGELILLDEASMCDRSMANALLRTGARLIVALDRYQLPPVSGTSPYANRAADAELWTVHRQALLSPILRQATRVRECRLYTADGDEFRVERRARTVDLINADVVLCWRNATRAELNVRIRRLRGFRSPLPERGEPIVCLRNAREYGLVNGAIYTLAEPYQPASRRAVIEIDGQVVEVPHCEFTGGSPSFNTRSLTAFDYGYCLTVHKSQGSEWDSVVLIDEYVGRADRRRWLYTGITRAAERIVVARSV